MKHQHDKYKDIQVEHYWWRCRVQGCQWKSRLFAVKP